MADAETGDRRLRRNIQILAAASVAVLDGFDVFSLSLMMPAVSRELSIPTVALGGVFASSMAGMIVGAVGGSAIAEKGGALRTLLVSFVFFGGAALCMPLVGNVTDVALNRLISGVGLGAAAPIAAGLLNRASDEPPSEFMISLFWAGIGFGGILASLFSYAVTPIYGWQSIFLVGGLLPIPVAAFVLIVFSGTKCGGSPTVQSPRLSDLFSGGRAARTLIVAGMFFFGFVTTSLIVYWLPTILSARAASASTVSAAFAGVNGGAVIGTLLFGWLGSLGRPNLARSLAWSGAAVCAFGAGFVEVGVEATAALAVAATMIAAGAQALCFALANTIYRDRGLQTTTVGGMAGTARLGQFLALSVSGFVATLGGRQEHVFALAAACAAVAAALSLLVGRSRHRQ